MLTFGFDDYIGGYTATGYIRINGIEWLKLWTTGLRGFNFLELSVDDCAPTNTCHFDTYASTSNSNDMVTYINSLHQPTVLIGITVDDAALSLTATARNTLKAIGVDVSSLAFRSKAAFVTQIGNPSASVLKMAAQYGDNLRFTAAVRCTYIYIYELNVINIVRRWQALFFDRWMPDKFITYQPVSLDRKRGQ
jgi:Interleukin-like EMT inducer